MLLLGFKKGSSKLTEGNALFETIYEICFFILLAGYFIFYNVRSLQLTFVGVGLAGSLLVVISKAQFGRLKNPLNTIWYSLFFILAEFSSMWAHSPENATDKFLRLMLIMLVISLSITQYVDTVRGAERLLKIFVLSVALITVVQFIFTPVNEWTAGYFGSAVGGNNTNYYGYIVSMAAIVSFYFAYTKGERRYYLTTVLFLVASILSSSRKSLAIFVAGIILLVFLSTGKKHHMRHLFLIVFVSFLILILLFVDESLYAIIGYRFESLLGHLSGEASEQENSIAMREYFIEFAKTLFKQKPFIGHGFYNFSVLLSLESEVNNQVYAHNNYWELLADLGILGFITYYWFYAYLLIKFIVKFFKEKDNPICSLALTMIIAQIVLEWGVVSMTLFYAQIVLSLIYVCSYASNSNRVFHYAPQQQAR